MSFVTPSVSHDRCLIWVSHEYYWNDYSVDFTDKIYAIFYITLLIIIVSRVIIDDWNAINRGVLISGKK